MHQHCDDYSRSHRAAAGAGLPAIEPGMPDPAGTGLTRRSMMLRSLGLGVAVYGAGAIAGSERVEAAINDALGEHKVVLSVFMDGGWDSLSVLPPLGHGRLHDLRPNLARAIDQQAATAFAEDPSLFWHPSLSGLRDLYAGADVGVAVAPAVGYTSPNYSHFTSRHFWEVGELDVGGTTGWMGRYLDRVGRPDVPLQGISMGTTLSPALATQNVPVAAIQSLSDYGYWFAGTWGKIAERAEQSIRNLATKASGDPQRDLSRLVTGASFDLVDDLDAVKPTPATEVAYPAVAHSPFVQQLKDVARLLGTRVSGSALPIRSIALRGHGGYDTHAGQNPGFSNNLKVTGDAIKAFWADLKARGQDDRVVMLVWSEFGRRPTENGSGGCDHGAAGTAFVIGKNVRQQLIGEHPGLKAFGATDSGLQQDGNVRVTSDFRGIYSALLEQWLDTDAAGIIPGAGNRPGSGSFARPVLIG